MLEPGPPTIEPEFIEAARAIVQPEHLSLRPSDRLAYARDLWPGGLIMLSGGRSPRPPELVVWPADESQVARLLALCSARNVAAVPYGAGSGVCGGTLFERPGIAIDLKRMDRLLSVDRDNLTIEVEPGIVGQHLEDNLNRLGLTLGHFPSSIMCSTTGGHLAARSAGQMSARYGTMADIVLSLRVALPDGSLRDTPWAARHLPFADPADLFVGSEGTLGIIVRARLRVHPLPAHRAFRAFLFPGIEAGLSAMRTVLQEGFSPAVLRLYDPFDTLVARRTNSGDGDDELIPPEALSPAGPGRRLLAAAARRLSNAGLARVVQRPALLNRTADLLPAGCLLVLVFEGAREMVELEENAAVQAAAAAGGSDQGEEPARRWFDHRYHVSYKQSRIFTAGAFVDTMEVACTWDRVVPLYRAVRTALERNVFVMAHFSHAYPDGCCIYFSFVGSRNKPAGAMELYRATWDAALGAVRAAGGTISHHHGIGSSKARFMPAEHGAGIDLLRAVKAGIDPAGVMNPGKLGL